MVTIQQAAVNALVTYLKGLNELSGVVIDTRWPSPSKPLPPKAITIVTTGRRRDESIPEHVVGQTNVSTTRANYTWQFKACTQPIQIDIWAKTDFERDDILARLDSALNAGESATGLYNEMPVGDGLLVQVADGWANTFADFSFESAEVDDSSDDVQRAEYRATITGEAHVMLTADRNSARTVVINFRNNLKGSDGSEHIQTTTITSNGSSTVDS